MTNVSNRIRCPECGSTNVECVEKSHHDHICYGCGHTHLGATDLAWFIRREADLAARPGQMDRLLGIAKAVEALSGRTDPEDGTDG